MSEKKPPENAGQKETEESKEPKESEESEESKESVPSVPSVKAEEPKESEKSKEPKDSKESDPSMKAEEPENPEESATDFFPVVGLGASAGGVQALETFFEHVKKGTGAAFVVIQHLAPDRESVMPGLLGKRTELSVLHAEEEMKLAPEHVYVLPPGKEMRLRDGVLDLRERRGDGTPMPIDTFFRSLAVARQERSIGVVLSGSGTDGTLGAKAIKGEGGLVLVQDEEQAGHPNMPRSAIEAGVADRILSVEEMPRVIADYVSHPVLDRKNAESEEESLERDLRSILMIVRTQTGIDFSNYKPNTVRRRIARRMALQRVEDYTGYRAMLRDNPPEVERLFKDLTINVTRFFRDESAMETLVEKGLRPMMADKSDDTSLRIWVPGCSSGEEAYSLAILLLEAVEEMEKFFDIKIFATDINKEAIQAARSGLYPEAISADISQHRLRRFFSKKGQRYQVDSKIRDMVVFAVHDVTADPPFSNLDIISCRNLLIYMNTDLQKKVLPVFHFSLNSHGRLFLGTSETAGEASDLFSCESKKAKLYRKIPASPQKLSEYNPSVFQASQRKRQGNGNGAEAANSTEEDSKKYRGAELRQTVQETLLKKYADSAVLLDENGTILYFHGQTGRFLSPPEGVPDFTIFHMTSGELHLRLSQGMEQVRRNGEAVTVSNIQFSVNDRFSTMELHLTPADGKRGWVLAEFRETPKSKSEGDDSVENPESGGKSEAVDEMENRLRSTQQELQATIEELETSNEELKSANEELQANNEELQSTNEELESSKEELQSTNEELETLNSELYSKNQELMKAEDDLKNLFASTEVATLFLDEDLRIQRFTPATEQIFNLQDGDGGRRISDITCNLAELDVAKVADRVLDKLDRHESKVTTRGGEAIYLMRAAPYRTRENVIEGVVLTFMDVTEYENQAAEARDARNLFEKIAEVMREPILVMDEDFVIRTANPAFYRMFQTSPAETEEREVFALGDGQWDAPELRRFLEEVVPESRVFSDYVIDHEFPRIGRRKIAVSGRKIAGGEVRRPLILVTFRDAAEDAG
jgi:two-component system CheB/CheR fusion protein